MIRIGCWGAWGIRSQAPAYPYGRLLFGRTQIMLGGEAFQQARRVRQRLSSGGVTLREPISEFNAAFGTWDDNPRLPLHLLNSKSG